jgi:hypothetical protein
MTELEQHSSSEEELEDNEASDNEGMDTDEEVNLNATFFQGSRLLMLLFEVIFRGFTFLYSL